MFLYRAVSLAERDDLLSLGRFRPTEFSCEGKHFATTEADARRWGAALYRADRFAVVRINAPDASVARMHNWAALDGIGPAYFATIEQLSGARIVKVTGEVTDEP